MGVGWPHVVGWCAGSMVNAGTSGPLQSARSQSSPVVSNTLLKYRYMGRPENRPAPPRRNVVPLAPTSQLKPILGDHSRLPLDITAVLTPRPASSAGFWGGPW